MGQVFLAEQAEPERRVALKLKRAEIVGPGAVERFKAEQQALARLQQIRAIRDAKPAARRPRASIRVRLAWVSWLRGRYLEAERDRDDWRTARLWLLDRLAGAP